MLLIFIFASILAVFLLSPLRGGWFWVIDDHEIVRYASEFKKHNANPFLIFLQQLSQSEVGRLFEGDILRYRPVYYSLRVLQSFLFGLNPAFYFAFNALLFYVGLLSFGLAAARFFSWPVVLASMCLVTGMGYNQDLWARLGPSERDSFAYLMLFLWAFVRQDKSKWSWPICCLTAALAIGSKENFLLLLLPLAVPFYRQIQNKRYVSLLWALVPLLVSLPVGYVVIYAVFVAGQDMYAESASSGTILSLALDFFTTKAAALCGALFVSLFSFYVYLRKTKKVSVDIDIVKSSIFYFSIVFLLILGNFIFYRGNISFYHRYGFPYYLLILIEILICLYIFSLFINSYYNLILINACRIIFIIIVAVSFYYINNAKKLIKIQISKTNSFHDTLLGSQKYKNICIINGGEIIRSYEPYFSFKSYHEAGFSPEVLYFPLFPDQKKPLYHRLEAQLKKNIGNQKNVNLNKETYLLTANTGGTFTVVEHAADFRKINEVIADRDLQFDNSGNVSLGSSVTFFLPYDQPGITGITIYGDFSGYPEAMFSMNGMPVPSTGIERAQEYLLLPISTDAAAVERHPQLLELGIHVIKGVDKRPPVKISAFELIR